MKRELSFISRKYSGCCPGHDRFPTGSYKNNRSKRARAKLKIVEHKFVRSINKRNINREVKDTVLRLAREAAQKKIRESGFSRRAVKNAALGKQVA